MKAISIHAPWGAQIMAGWKTEEYRSWQTDYRGDLLICTSKKQYGPQFLHGYAIGHCKARQDMKIKCKH